MAPLPPTGRAGTIAYLKGSPSTEHHFPIGGPTVQGGVIYEGGVWRLRRAGFDEEGWKAFCDAQKAAEKPIYPEHADRFRVPTGEILAEAPDLPSFIAAIEKIDWPMGW